jgi:hypothetical protein
MVSGVRTRLSEFGRVRPLQFLTAAILVAATAAAASPAREQLARAGLITPVEEAVSALPPPEPVMELVWQGADLDGDGRADFANPTGQAPREHDAYGEGRFGARRDGGSRRHEGVDYAARPGQPVHAPISGYVTKIGYAYAGDTRLKFVEITNPALRIAARVFYINPKVEEGDAVAIGRPVGTARSLQRRYPGGMTDHVHLEIIDRRGVRIDAEEVLTAQYVPADSLAAD